jgi:hypothetical protein
MLVLVQYSSLSPPRWRPENTNEEKTTTFLILPQERDWQGLLLELISMRSIREQYLKMKRYLKIFVREDDERKIKFIWHVSSWNGRSILGEIELRIEEDSG